MSLRNVETFIELPACKVCRIIAALPKEDADWLRNALASAATHVWIAKQCNDDPDTPNVGETAIRVHRRDCVK